MKEIGLREVRQSASELVRRAEAGERMTITVSGRAAAELGPARAQGWQPWSAIADVFATGGDDTWDDDLRRLDHDLRDPWET